MSNEIILHTKYHSGYDFGGLLSLGKFSVKHTGTQERPTNRMSVTFEGKGSVKSARMHLDFDVAVPLARALLGVAEGYVSESVTELA